MKDRLLEFMNREQVSASKLAEIIDVQASSISHILTERNKPGFEFLVKLFAAFPKLNPKWLMLGNGQMYLDGQPERNMNEIQSENPETASQPQQSDTRKIEKIIIFFSDNTFETYKKE